MTNLQKQLVVTPRQYGSGYLLFLGGARAYTLIRRLPDGNYLVKEPEV